jgi:hypothetical protein
MIAPTPLAFGIELPRLTTMRYSRTAVAAFLLFTTGTSSLLSQQSSACRAADSTSARLVRWVTHIATGTDPAAVQTRSLMQVPQASAGQVSYVTTNSVCSKIVSPYNSVTGMTDATTGAPIAASGKLYVIKVGSVYVALDPVKTFGEYALYVTLDSKYKVLFHGMG